MMLEDMEVADTVNDWLADTIPVQLVKAFNVPVIVITPCSRAPIVGVAGLAAAK